MTTQSRPPRLNANRIPNLAPGTYTDPGQMGLQLRVRERADGKLTRSWLLRFKFRGEESRILLGHFPDKTLDAARGLAREYREKAAEGIDPRRARPRRFERASPQSVSAAVVENPHTVDFLVSEFIERHVKATRKRPEYAVRILRQEVLSEWKGRDARAIKPREVIELLDVIVGRGSAVMANRTASLLTQMFKFGIHRTIVSDSPVKLLYRPGGKERPRERALTDQEISGLLKDPDRTERFARLRRAILILLLTGQRRGELALARWRDIDLKAGTWRIPDEHAKGGRGHVVPLTPWAVDEFRELKVLADGSAFVMPTPEGDAAIDPKLLTRNLARRLHRYEDLGVAEFTLHDLRRTCRTGLAKLQVPPHVAERVLNHVQEKIVGTYDTHDYATEKRAALEQWAAHVQSLRR
jgi:integrase